jgi:hypothetical protein
MSTLRKACARCTASKRKCIVQKPKCARCLQKNLDCVYDLEPLEAPVARLDKLLTFGINPSRWGPFGICIINNVRARSSDLDPAVCLPGQSRVLEIVRLGFVTVPDLVRAKKPAVFVHPKLQLAGVDNHFTALVDDKAPGVFCESFKRLFEVEVQAASLGEALTALQAALVHIAGSIFSPCAAEQAEAQKWFEMIPDWTKALLACVDAGLPKRQSPWQDWLLGESKL